MKLIKIPTKITAKTTNNSPKKYYLCSKIPSMSFYTRLFQVAAAWNIIAAITVFGSFKKHFVLFYNVTINKNPHFLLWLYHYNFWLIVLMMGVGYYLVSRNLQQNWAVALIGAIGKLAIACSWTYLYCIGIGTKLLLLGAIGDAIFALFFIHFLWNIDQLNT